MIKIGIGLPAYRGVIASGQMKMWVQFGACMNRPNVREVAEVGMLADVDMNGIDNARNALTKVARHAGIDWLLMVDSDTWCEPGSALVQMILDAEELGAAAVAAPTRIRGYEAPLAIYRYVKNTDDNENGTVRVMPLSPKEFPDKPFEVDGAGTGIFALHTGRCGGATFAFVERGGVRVSEDIEFCRQLREAGQTILCDPRVVTMHVNKPDVLVYSPHQQLLGG